MIEFGLGLGCDGGRFWGVGDYERDGGFGGGGSGDLTGWGVVRIIGVTGIWWGWG